MAMTVEWYGEDKTVFYFVATKGWTWEDYYSAHDRAIEMLKEVDHTAHIVYDMTEADTIPNNALVHFKKMAQALPAQIGLSVVVSNSMLIRVIFNAFKTVTGDWARNYRFVTSVDAALDLIARESQPQQ